MAKVTLKNTKSIIFKAYQEALMQNERLQLDLNTTNRAFAKSKTDLSNALDRVKAAQNLNRPVVTPKTKSVPTVKTPQVTAGINNMSDLGGAINALIIIQNNIGTAIAQCANMQVIEAEQLEELQEKITDCRTTLKELYDIDFNENTLSDLIVSYEETQETFNDSFEEKQKDFKESLEEKTKNWEKEQEERERKIEDLVDNDDTEQEREQEEHAYQLRLERNLEADNYAQKHKLLQDELTEIKEVKSEEFKLREDKVKEEEKTFKEYKEKHEELPKKLEKAIKQAEHIGISIIERDAKIKMNLLKKEVENELNANGLKAESLSTIIAKQEAQINRLTVQLENALQQAQTLAIKAIEGTAHAESFSAMKAIAMEQAKNVGKSK
jgi:hypothetical protein